MRGYDAERRVFARRRQLMTMDEARSMAAKLFAHFGVEPINVRRTIRQHPHRKAGSWFWHGTPSKPPRIALDLEAPDWVVCHEVAHYVVWLQGKTGHGRPWAAAYVEAVRVAITPSYADRLERAFQRCGLLPVTPPA
jgi:hypothetical protein